MNKLDQKSFSYIPTVVTCTKAVCRRNPELCENVVCQGLPTKPNPSVGRILVTGASGYVGGRLIVELINRGYQVRAMVRRKLAVQEQRWPGAEVVEADALNPDSLMEAMKGIRVAYYLIHSMMLGPQSFSTSDLEASRNFSQCAEASGLDRIIYLGGLGERNSDLSAHLRNRIEVAEVLRSGRTPVTILRAAVIIGSGSASYEIMQHLVSVLRLIFVPKW
ncbi:MAG: family oxidoreductase, partial [Acidobacteria bacterium]|nr:family oxidoreductase [Acidobacteriota bacterium]